MNPITVSNTAWPAVIEGAFCMMAPSRKTAKNGYVFGTYREQYRSLPALSPPENHLAALIAHAESLV
ncbi:hypothetical protein [Mesorhizobium sp.]|uniref:hypothetical protein n=1 Tax=Mesorhizobium sp. TaxID=1871066 RepID=UPI0025E42FAC|nr:hypothetical protein [Mesorhizobium sp.]